MRAMLSLRRRVIPRAVMTVMAVETDFVSGGTFVKVERHDEDCDIVGGCSYCVPVCYCLLWAVSSGLKVVSIVTCLWLFLLGVFPELRRQEDDVRVMKKMMMRIIITRGVRLLVVVGQADKQTSK